MNADSGIAPLSPVADLALALALFVTTAVSILWLRNGWVAILSYHAVILLALRMKTGTPHTPLPHSSTRPQRGADRPVHLSTSPERYRPFGTWTPFSIGVCALSAFTGPVLGMLLPHILKGSVHERLMSVGLTGAAWLLFLPYFAFVNPVLEELYWRGLLARSGRDGFLMHLLFAAYHMAVLPIFVAPLFLPVAAAILAVSAAVWARITREAGGLGPAILSHMLADVGIIAAVAIRADTG